MPIDHPLGEMGWGDLTNTIERNATIEQLRFEESMNSQPICFKIRGELPDDPELAASWNKFQDDHGRLPGSNDMTLLTAWAFGKKFWFLPQLTGSCFPAGTLIRMADGSHKPIEQIGLFNQVLTAEGNIGWVSNIQGREINENIYAIKLWGHPKVRMTSEHPVLTKRGYVKACDITLEDYVAIPKYMACQNTIIQTEGHYFTNSQTRRRVAAGKEIYHHKTTGGYVEVQRVMPDIIELTNEFGWICGIYLAEGNSDEYKTVWTFHPKESETIAKRLVDSFENLFGIKASKTIQYYNDKRRGEKIPRTCKVVVHGIPWASFFQSTLGSGSGRKQLSPDLASGPKEFLEGVIEGWIDGDGHENESLIDGVTISKCLAFDMHAISNALGQHPTLSTHQPTISHGVKERQRRYDVIIRHGNDPMQCITEEKTIWKKVRGIEQEPFTGRVYNFEVNGDNSYVADGIGVHNCVFSNTFRAVVDRMICELGIQGQGEEYFGNEEFSLKSIAPHMISYGFARQIANMRGSDGLYCEPMIKSFMNIGFVTCSTPKLKEIMSKAGANSDDDYPEPKSTSIVRRIQNWEFNEVLRPYADFRLMESTVIRSGDDLERASKQRKPAMNCSGYAIKVIGKSADGWNIHGRDPSNSWPHNMSWRGHRVDSKGRVYDILANESWVQRGDPNPEKYIYYIPREEAHKMVSHSSNTAMTIGDIDFPKSAPSGA